MSETERASALDRAQGALKAATGRDDPTFARAAQIAVVAQAEATHRIADALERVADTLAPPTPERAGPAPWLEVYPPAADGTVLISNRLNGSSTVANLGDVYSVSAFPGWRMHVTWEREDA